MMGRTCASTLLKIMVASATAGLSCCEEGLYDHTRTRALLKWGDSFGGGVSTSVPFVSGSADIGGQISSGAKAAGGSLAGAAQNGANAAKQYGPTLLNPMATSQLTAAQQSLGPVVADVLQGDISGALEVATDAEIASAKHQLGTIASAIPGYNKLDPHCNGFICSAGAVGIDTTCADAFIAQAKQAYCGSLPPTHCNVIKGKKIDWVTEASATEEIVAGALATGGSGALGAALHAIAEEMKTQYEAFIANAGPVADDVIKSAINNLGRLINGVTQCGLNIDLMAKLSTSSGKQCAVCLCAATPNAFTPFLAWRVKGQCNAIATAAAAVENALGSLLNGEQALPRPSP